MVSISGPVRRSSFAPSLAGLLVLLLAAGLGVLLATPAAACSCGEIDTSREGVLRAGGAIEGAVVAVGEALPNPPEWIGGEDDAVRVIEVAVTRALGVDPGPRMTVAAYLGDSSGCGLSLAVGQQVAFLADAVDDPDTGHPDGDHVLSLCSLVRDGFDAALADPGPVATAQPIRYLGRPIDPDRAVGGLTSAGAYVSQVALPSTGPLVRCPGDVAAVVQHGPGVFTGGEDISWSRLDLTTLEVRELVDIAVLNPDPAVLQNVVTGVECMDADASTVVALTSWWEPPDEKPQRLIRVEDGVVTELAVAPIWQIWSHDGTLYARVGETGVDVLTVDPATGRFTPHGTLPAGGVLDVAGDGTWGIRTDSQDINGTRTIDRIRLVPDIAVQATTDITDRFITALADGRTMLTLPPAAGGPLVEMLDEALAVEDTWEPGDQVGVVAEAPDGAWLRDRGGRLTRWTRGVDPLPTGIEADMVLPFGVVPADPFPPAELSVVSYPLPTPEPHTQPTSDENPAADPTATPASTAPPSTDPRAGVSPQSSDPTTDVVAAAMTAFTAVVLVGALIALARRR